MMQEFDDYEDDAYLEEEEDIVDDDLSQYMSGKAKISNSEVKLDLLSLKDKKVQQPKAPRIKKSLEKQNKKSVTTEIVTEFKHEEEVVEKKPILEAIDFKLHMKQCSSMNLERAPIGKIFSYAINPSWASLYMRCTQDFVVFNRTRKKNGKPELKLSEIQKSIQDDDGKTHVKWIEKEVKDLNFLKRSNMASTTHGAYIILHGGKSSGGVYNDLIIYNTATGEIKIINVKSIGSNLWWTGSDWNGYEKTVRECPPISNHAISLINGKDLFIFGAHSKHVIERWNMSEKYSNEMRFYVIANIFDMNTIECGWRVASSHVSGFYHYDPIRVVGSTGFITQRTDFKVISNGTQLYLFGGTTNGIQGKDDLFRLTFETSSISTQVVRCNEFKIGNQAWPQGRFAHSMDLAYDSFFIYGGKDGDYVLNDLWSWDISKSMWKEYIVDDVIPPSLYDHGSILLNGKTLFLHGGKSGSKSCTSNIYQFDSVEKKWVSIHIMGKSDSFHGDLQVVTAGHSFCSVNGIAYAIGGTDGSKTVDNFTMINDLFDDGSGNALIEYLWQKKLNDEFCDATLAVRDAEGKWQRIKAHKCVLGVRCPTFASMFETQKDEYQIVDTSFDHLSSYIQFLYTGTLVVQKDLPKFLEFVGSWNEDIYETLEIIGTSKANQMDVAVEVMEKLEEDMNTLIESENYSDTSIVLGDLSIPAHQVILCRAPYFESMILSGMSESVTGIIDLEGFERAPILEILGYLYTNQLNVSSQNCIGVLMYAHMFGLSTLSSNCRTIAYQNFNPKNVLDVLGIAELYSDQILKRLCLQYVKKNVDLVQGTSEFDDLDSKLRKDVDAAIKKYQDLQDKKLKRKKK